MPRERKKSSLQLPRPTLSPDAATAETAEVQSLAATDTTPAPPAKAKPQRYYYYADVEVERRLRAAYAAVSGVAGPYASYNEFRIAGMLMLAEKLEDELNNGEPFPEAPSRFAPGRPLKQV